MDNTEIKSRINDVIENLDDKIGHIVVKMDNAGVKLNVEGTECLNEHIILLMNTTSDLKDIRKRL